MAAMALPKRGRAIPKYGASDRDAELGERFDHLYWQAHLADQDRRHAALYPRSPYRPPILGVPPPAEAERQMEEIRRRKGS